MNIRKIYLQNNTIFLASFHLNLCKQYYIRFKDYA